MLAYLKCCTSFIFFKIFLCSFSMRQYWQKSHTKLLCLGNYRQIPQRFWTIHWICALKTWINVSSLIKFVFWSLFHVDLDFKYENQSIFLSNSSMSKRGDIDVIRLVIYQKPLLNIMYHLYEWLAES